MFERLHGSELYGTAERLILPVLQNVKFDRMLIKRMKALRNVGTTRMDPSIEAHWDSRIEQVKKGIVEDAAFRDWLIEEAAPIIEVAPDYVAYLSALSGDYKV